jgi:Mrr N-terminal domain
MTPTIRIDDEVFDALKAHAEPLVDTPNSALRRVLGLNEGKRPARQEQVLGNDTAAEKPVRQRQKRARTSRSSGRAPRGTTLPDGEYEQPLLEVLVEKGGRAPTSEVLDALGEHLAGRLTQVDHGTLDSGQVRWRNRAQFVRLKLVEHGEMIKGSPRGIWEIAPAGRRRVGGGIDELTVST